MSKDVFDQALVQALEEISREDFRHRVDQEKARILRERNQSLWQRLINKLPFTITRRKP